MNYQTARFRDKVEEVLSYLTGLGPVGEPVEIDRNTMTKDIGYKSNFSIYQCLNTLIVSGHIRRLARGSGNTFGLLVVQKRLEDTPK